MKKFLAPLFLLAFFAPVFAFAQILGPAALPSISVSTSVSGSSVTISVSGTLSVNWDNTSNCEYEGYGQIPYDHPSYAATNTVPSSVVEITAGPSGVSGTIPVTITPSNTPNGDCLTMAQPYSFSGSKIFNNVSSGSVTVRVTDNNSRSASASKSFTVATYTATSSVSGAGGGVSPSSISGISPGTSVQFIVSPDTTNGYTKNNFVESNDDTSCKLNLSGWSGNTYTTGQVLKDNCNYSFRFTPPTVYTVTPSKTGNGSISPSSPVTVNAGQTVAFTLTPSSVNDYIHKINLIGGTCQGQLQGSGQQGAAHTFTTDAVSSNCTVMANFKSGTITPSPMSCSIPAGASSCNINIQWSTTNPVGTSAVTALGMTNVYGDSGSQSFPVPYGGRMFFLYNDMDQLAQTPLIDADCASGSSWNDSTCVAVPSEYVDLTAAIPPSSQNSATVNVSRTFTSSISNTGDISSGRSFPIIFQTSTSSSFSSGVTDYRLSPDMSTLAAGASATATSPAITFTSAGTYYVRACADKSSAAGGGVVTESNEQNNCGSPRTVSVTGSTAPDLTADVVVPTPLSAEAGQSMTFSSTIRNTGTANATGTITHLFQFDEDADHTTAVSDSRAITTTTTLAATSGSAPVQVSYTFASAGTKYVRVCADRNASDVGTVAELDENNNCSTSWTAVDVSAVAVPPASEGVDLTATIASPYNATVNESQTFEAYIANIGSSSTGSSFPYFFQIAADPNGGGTLTDLSSSTMSTLAAGASSPVAKSYTFTEVGGYSVRFCADKSDRNDAGDITEDDDDNNCGAWANITVSEPFTEDGGGEHGGWTLWSANPCNVSCGGGIQVRTCTNPAPSSGGLACTDPDNPNYDGIASFQACNLQACPGNPVINGQCYALHNGCVRGIANDRPDSGNAWKWECAGSGAGGATVQCSEPKKVPTFEEN